MMASLLESTGVLLTILTPLVVVPLTVIMFYLRSLREHHDVGHTDLMRRITSVEQSIVELRGMIAAFERDFTTKEEWLRECMLARRTLEQLNETTVRLETAVYNTLPLSTSRISANQSTVDRIRKHQTGVGEPGHLGEGSR